MQVDAVLLFVVFREDSLLLDRPSQFTHYYTLLHYLHHHRYRHRRRCTGVISGVAMNLLQRDNIEGLRTEVF